MESKQHSTKTATTTITKTKPQAPTMSQWRNQKGNKKIPGDKWKCKHNFSKSMGYSKNSSKREVYRDPCSLNNSQSVEFLASW